MPRTSTCPTSTDRQEASSVPRARSQRATPRSVPTASSRPSWRIDGALISHRFRWRHGPVSGIRGRDRPGTWSIASSTRNDDLSVPAESIEPEELSAVKLSTGRPRTASQSRRRFSQPLLASSVPAGWKVACKPSLAEPSSGLANAGEGIPEVDLGIVARRRQGGAVWAPGDRRRRWAAGSSGRRGPTPIRESGTFGSILVAIRDGDLGAVRAEGQVLYPSPARPGAAWAVRSARS